MCSFSTSKRSRAGIGEGSGEGGGMREKTGDKEREKYLLNFFLVFMEQTARERDVYCLVRENMSLRRMGRKKFAWTLNFGGDRKSRKWEWFKKN